jgi:hypothetical protein
LCATVSVPVKFAVVELPHVSVNVCVPLPIGIVKGVAGPETVICGLPVVEKFEMVRSSVPVLDMTTVDVIGVVVNAEMFIVDEGAGADAYTGALPDS